MHDRPTPRTGPDAPVPAPQPTPTPQQRWRLILARDADAGEQTQRELAEAWEGAIVAAGLPLARAEGPASRPRLSFGAPLPVGVAAEGELIDVVLTERWPIWRVREALTPVLPTGWRLVGLEDVWLGGPPLAGRVAAADYRITLQGTDDGPPVEATDAARAGARLLAAPHLERERPKGAGVVRYDLRPLLLDVAVVDAGRPVVVRARTRIHQELGSGRPEEVVAALGDALGRSLAAAVIVRERLWLADDLAADASIDR